MYKTIAILVCLLLAVQVNLQQCQQSAIRGMASGIINLGLPTSPTAQSTYSQSLAGATLGLQAEVFHAFALAGFQAASGQTYYSLVVDQVIFSNGNTLMNFTMSYDSRATPNYVTSWSKIKLSWLVVSTNFYTSTNPNDENSLGNLVWAGTFGFSGITATTTGALITNSIFGAQPAVYDDATCGYLNTSPPGFDLNCGAARPNARFMIHTYIMGFRFNPTGGLHTLAASVLLGNGLGLDRPSVDQAWLRTDFVTLVNPIPNSATGPSLTIKAFASQLTYLKFSIVVTTIPDMSFYPATTNGAPFVYSGVYMGYTLFNNPKALVQDTSANPFASRLAAPANRQNMNYFGLLNARYQIFGLSSFEILTLPASVTVLQYDLSFTDLNTMLLNTNNVNYLTNVKVSADRYNSLLSACTATTTNILTVESKVFTIVPPLNINHQNIYQPNANLDFRYEALASTAAVPLSDRVSFTNTLTLSGIVPGMAYRVTITLVSDNDNTASPFFGFPSTTIPVIQYIIALQGNVIVQNTLTYTPTAAAAGPALPLRTANIPIIGYIFTVPNPTIVITINTPRPTEVAPSVRTLRFTTTTVITQYSQAYDPILDCCVTTCPPNSGVNVESTPPSCKACNSGLFYNNVLRICQCQTGFYSVIQSVTRQQQCYPCQAPLCQTCLQATPLVCTACVNGAAPTSGNLGNCECLAGFYRTTSTCTACPVKCATCQTAGVCLTCSNTVTRSASPNCNCLDGFFQSGTAVCSRCSSLCRTCTTATTCTDCFAANNRALQNGQCVCAIGFYQVVNPDGSLTCAPCHSSCTSCSLLPTLCNNCDGASNRVLGIDSNNQQACICKTGFIENANRQCVQPTCSAATSFCAECHTVQSNTICLGCIAQTNRFLAFPSQTCQCNAGFFDLNNVCTACSSGCATCQSATTNCRCVASATNNNNGSCSCLAGFFFATVPSRHCKSCPRSCSICSSDTSCSTCNPNYILSDGACTCPSGFFVNPTNFLCTPCLNGCQTCTTTTSCIACNVPLLLQDNTCLPRCGPGYYQSGFTCLKCSEGCASCDGQFICQICSPGRLQYNGFCPTSCPTGAVANAARNKCIPCNAPCLTCSEHPSKCTSCSACCGSLFNNECLTSCPVGTYSVNGTCKYCSFSCASCIGTNDTCTACQVGKVLYNGACYDKCPYIMIGGICTFNCAAGLYKTNINKCERCDSSCATCEVVPQNCTTCSPGFAHKGRCVSPCPFGFVGLEGVCKQCNPECDGCVTSCATCINCAAGFFKCGSSCCKTCPPNQFVESSINTCISCNPKCKTCSTQQFCTTCANPQAVPVNGVCNDCSYPCQTCGTAPSICTTCVQGFSLVGSTCITACPTGASPVNGVCQCAAGFIYSNQCVTQCPTKFGPVGGQCVACSDKCASCQGTSATCTSCLNGFALNPVTGTCDLAPNCQFGQYFSQSSNGCARICPQNTFYYESVCLTNCLQGYQDNGVGGCIAKAASTGCSHPYYLNNGICISNCPAATYANSQKRICQSCSSNCFSCLTNTFCYACNAGYDLVNGFCVASSTTCPSGQFRYNGVCYGSCPLGTCSQGGYCQRVCPAGTWSHNNGCYRSCPTKYTTNDACVQNCPAGTTLQNNICQPSAQSCSSGSYFDATSNSCKSCNFPCTACSLTGSYCTACANGLTLNQNLCVSTSSSCGSGFYQDANRKCQPCASKCSTCISATSCSQCANGFTFNGFDCIVAVAKLQKINMAILNVCRRNNVAIVSINLNIIPNGLSPSQRSNFFLVVPSSGDKVSFVNQWQPDATTFMVAINYAEYPLRSTAYLAINAKQLASSYASIGYTADSSSFVSASVSGNNANCPASLVIPASTSSVTASSAGDLATQTLSSIGSDADNLQ